MHLVLVTALIAVCAAEKLDRTYLPPASATSAGGSPGSLQTPFKTFNQGLGGLPKGSYGNSFEGVVVDAAAPGTRASGTDETGLGAPRIAYGSIDSKVGDAAFTADVAFPRVGVNSGLSTPSGFGANQQSETRPERVQSSRDRVSNIVKYESDVSHDRFNYAFETDNGIVAEENGIEVNGVKAQGGYSYTGDDGQVYSVTYTADEDGYRPKGDHLPTPPPIPAEILKSLEKNAQDEAAGVVDDGSYDAQKYNTGEDYTKSDNGNGQYYGAQTARPGSRPQADPVASSSFNYQNNQGFISPSSNQFGSNPSFDTSKITSSNENNAVINNGVRPNQNAQTSFGLATNNEYLPPNNMFSQNRRPALNIPLSVQSDSQSGLPALTATSYNNIEKDKNINQPAFIPLSQQKLQEDKPKRPQANFPIFGKPTLIDSTLSIKDPFASGYTGNKFTQSKQPNQEPQAIGGSFEVVSGNVYSSKNEYLPPRRQSNRPNQYNVNQPLQGSTGIQANPQFPNSQFFNPNLQSASSIASVTRPISENQPSQIYNAQKPFQYTNNGFFNQLNQTPNRPLAPISSRLTSSSDFNGAPVSQTQYRPLSFIPQSPTLQPQTDLTTPFESNSNQNQGTAPVPVLDGPDSPSLMGSSNLPSLNSKPNNILGQNSFNSDKIQQAVPISSSILNDQTITSGSQNTAKPTTPEESLRPSSLLPNKLPINSQSSFSTQRPTFGQYSQPQGTDDSYIYNTPSKPFNTPTPRPSSIFPSSFDQSFKVTNTPFGNVPQLSDTPETFITSNTPADSTRYTIPSTLGPIFPTFPTKEVEQIDNTIQPQFNKVTQASTSSFPSPKPTASFERNQFGQFNTKPFQQINQSNRETQSFIQPGSSFAQATASVQPVTPGPVNYQPLTGNTKPTINQDFSPQSQQAQQYEGELYEYKKPPQSLPAPQNGVTSGQFGQTSQFGSSATTPQISQTQLSGAYKPGSQFGSQFTQQPSTFGLRPQNAQVSQDNQVINTNTPVQDQFGSQFTQQPSTFGLRPQNTQVSQDNQVINTNTPVQDQPGRFSSQTSKPTQNTQPIQGAEKFPPTYNNQTPSCCKKVSFGPQSSQVSEQNKTPQLGDQYRPDVGVQSDFGQKESEQGNKPVQSVSSFAGIGENFGGPRKPPSFDESGYHY